MAPSKSRALIALKSHNSPAKAARSCSTTTGTLTRMAAGDPEISKAYQDCVGRKNLARDRYTKDAESRAKDLAPKQITEAQAERYKKRLFFLTGRDPAVAAAALHKRLNNERRQDKAVDLEEALESLESIQSQSSVLKPIRKAIVDIWDRWCAKCKQHVVDDPCELCGRHTILVKGDGGPTTSGNE